MLTDWNEVEIPLQPTEARPDHLGQSGVLRTLVGTIERMPPGGCIALYGPWGSGKTALMRNARRHIEAGSLADGRPRPQGKHLTLWFDPWEYERARFAATAPCAAPTSTGRTGAFATG